MSLLTFTGDVMLGRAVDEYLKTLQDKSVIWGDVLNELKESDLVFVNLESALTRSTKKGKKGNPVFFFKSDPENVSSLTGANISYCCLANNHILDFGQDGLVETLKTLTSVNIKYSGAGRNIIEAKRPAELKIGSLKIKVFAFSDNEPSWEAKGDSFGINFIPINQEDGRFLDLLEEVKKAKSEGFFIIVSGHWGPNMVRVPPERHVNFAHKLIERGVDIFHGHSSHVFQGIEVYKGKVIFYDCGEMIDDYAVDPVLKNNESFLFQVHLKEDKVQKIVLKPIKIEISFGKDGFLKMSVKKAKGKEGRLISEKQVELSKNLVPNIEIKEDLLEINVKI